MNTHLKLALLATGFVFIAIIAPLGFFGCLYVIFELLIAIEHAFGFVFSLLVAAFLCILLVVVALELDEQNRKRKQKPEPDKPDLLFTLSPNWLDHAGESETYYTAQDFLERVEHFLDKSQPNPCKIINVTICEDL
jgi:multidrug efflux pump subunit AcrB